MKDETEKKKIQAIAASPFDWPWFEIFDQIFGSTTKINGIPNAIDQGVQNLHSHFEVQTFEVSDDVTQGTREHYCPPQQAPIFGHGNEEEAHAPSVGSNTSRTRVFKLSSVQGKANKRMENKRRKLDVGSSTIIDVIKEFLEGVK
jgi:hypothetical protein